MKTKQQTAVRDARGRWLPGTSGNDLGRPRTALAELCRAQITKHDLVSILGAIAARTGDYGTKKKIEITVADQIAAIKLLLLYGFGVPKNEVDSGDVRIEVTYDNRQVTVTNSTPRTSEDHTRGEALQHRLLRSPLGQDVSGAGPADQGGSAG